MTTPTTIKIDDAEYIRRDSVGPDKSLEGHDYCIVRSRDNGVMCGYVESIDGRTVTILQARQMWRWDSRFVLADLAEFGPRDASKCQFSAPMSERAIMLEACAVLTCTGVGAAALRDVKAQSK